MLIYGIPVVAVIPPNYNWNTEVKKRQYDLTPPVVRALQNTLMLADQELNAIGMDLDDVQILCTYRVPASNKGSGMSSKSFHLTAQAIDFRLKPGIVAPAGLVQPFGYTPRTELGKVFGAIANRKLIGSSQATQVIHEAKGIVPLGSPSWIHLAYAEAKDRDMVALYPNGSLDFRAAFTSLRGILTGRRA